MKYLRAKISRNLTSLYTYDKFCWTVFLLLLFDDISPFIDVSGRFCCWWWCRVTDVGCLIVDDNISTKVFNLYKVGVYFYHIHRYIISLSSSRSILHHVSAASLFQSPGSRRLVGFHTFARCNWRLILLLAPLALVHVLPVSYFVRDSEQITAPEAT